MVFSYSQFYCNFGHSVFYSFCLILVIAFFCINLDVFLSLWLVWGFLVRQIYINYTILFHKWSFKRVLLWKLENLQKEREQLRTPTYPSASFNNYQHLCVSFLGRRGGQNITNEIMTLMCDKVVLTGKENSILTGLNIFINSINLNI